MYLSHFSRSHCVSASKNLLAASLLSAGLILLSACSGELTPDEYLARAQTQHQRGEHKAAIIDLKSALQKAPNHAEARRLLGSIYLQQGAAAAAEKELHQALDLGITPEAIAIELARSLLAQGKYQELLDSTADLALTPLEAQANLLALRGHAFSGQGDQDSAATLYDQALLIDPSNAESGVGKAKIAMLNKDNKEARKLLEAVLNVTPDFAYAWSILGLIEARESNLEAAENAFKKAQQHPIYRDASQQQLVFTYIRQKQFEKAAALIATLRQRIKTNPKIDYLEGFLYFNQQRFPEAKASFDTLLGKLPNHLLGLLYSGATNAYLGNHPLAKKHLQRHLSQNPDNSFAQKLLAQVELAEGNPDEAQRLALPVLEQYPDDLVALNLLASASLSQGDQEAGLAYLQQAVTAKPESTEARIRLGEELARQGQVESGLESLLEAYRLDPDNNQVVETLIRQYLSIGQTDQALTLAQSHQKQHANEALPHALVGMVYVSLKDSTSAEQAFQQALSIEPGTTSAYNGLAILAIRGKKFDLAERYYQEALSHRPGDYQTVMNLVTLKKLQGDQAGLGAVLEEAVRVNPQAVELRILLGRVYLDVREPNRVIDLLNNVESPNRVQQGNILGLRAEAELAAGRFSQAKNSLTELIQLAPEDARVHFSLAQAHEGLGDREKMREHLDLAMRFNPGHLPAKLAMARVAVEEKQMAKAEVLLAELEDKVSPDDVVFILTKAQYAALKDDLPGAIKNYQRLFDLSPNGSNLLRLTQAQWRNDDKDSAMKNLEAWVNKYPRQTRVQHDLAQRYITLQRSDEAIAIYEQILKTDADNALALNNLAALLTESDPEAAVSYAKRTYALMPEDPAVMDTLAGAMLATNDTVGAQRMVERSLAKQPRNPDYLYRQAQLYAAKAENDKALDVLNRITATNLQFSQRASAEALREQLAP